VNWRAANFEDFLTTVAEQVDVSICNFDLHLQGRSSLPARRSVKENAILINLSSTSHKFFGLFWLLWGCPLEPASVDSTHKRKVYRKPRKKREIRHCKKVFRWIKIFSTGFGPPVLQVVDSRNVFFDEQLYVV